MTDDQIRILDDLPSSAVDLQVKDKVSVGNWRCNLFPINFVSTLLLPVKHPHTVD